MHGANALSISTENWQNLATIRVTLSHSLVVFVDYVKRIRVFAAVMRHSLAASFLLAVIIVKDFRARQRQPLFASWPTFAIVEGPELSLANMPQGGGGGGGGAVWPSHRLYN